MQAEPDAGQAWFSTKRLSPMRHGGLEARLGSVIVERDTAVAERDHAIAERNHAIVERDQMAHLLAAGRKSPQPSSPSPSPQQHSDYPVPREKLLKSSVDPDDDASCSAAGWHCVDAAGYSCMALTSAARSCWTAGRAISTIGESTASLFHSLTSGAAYSLDKVDWMSLSCLLCRPCLLPPPPPRGHGDETDDELEEVGAYDGVVLEAGAASLTPGRERLLAKRAANRTLVAWLAAGATLSLLWNTYHGGPALAMWTMLGALGGALGAAGGMMIAALATPNEDRDIESMSEWCQLAFEGSLLSGRNATARLSVAGAACLSGLTAGVCAWSVHEYEHHQRALLLWLVVLLLFLTFLVRHGFKVWRAGGCARGGRLRLMTRAGCGCRGCLWPSLL